MTVKTYRAEVTREDGWLMISVPELDLLTQAEHWGEVTLMARDVIALELDIEVEDVQVQIANRT